MMLHHTWLCGTTDFHKTHDSERSNPEINKFMKQWDLMRSFFMLWVITYLENCDESELSREHWQQESQQSIRGSWCVHGWKDPCTLLIRSLGVGEGKTRKLQLRTQFHLPRAKGTKNHENGARLVKGLQIACLGQSCWKHWGAVCSLKYSMGHRSKSRPLVFRSLIIWS